MLTFLFGYQVSWLHLLASSRGLAHRDELSNLEIARILGRRGRHYKSLVWGSRSVRQLISQFHSEPVVRFEPHVQYDVTGATTCLFGLAFPLPYLYVATVARKLKLSGQVTLIPEVNRWNHAPLT
ncbi:hypothetical protein F4804DRAFT_34210 [Jackrogersella minutella]|nr:hypothetical protein F4804DRAFT_34210 [Jackrogersella minutella]